MVALCQGCTGNGGDFTTSKPETTTTGTNPGTTTTQTHEEDCCQKVTLESNGGIQQHYHEALGTKYSFLHLRSCIHDLFFDFALGH